MSRGSAIFGNVGATSHMAYSLIGDAVNVAALLTQLARGGETLLSADLAAHAAELMRELQVAEMPQISPTGKVGPVPYFRLAGNDARAPRAAAYAARHSGARAAP